MTAWFVSLFWTVALISAPLVFAPTGYVRNLTGFQGILNHPQVLGVFLAPFVAYFVLNWITTRNASFSLYSALVAGVLLILTESRTAAFAVAVGLGIGIVMLVVRRGFDAHEAVRQRLSIIGAVSVLVVAVGSLAGGFDYVSRFALKTRGAARVGTLAEAFDASRGGLVTDSWTRISESPIFGHGFGVPAGVDRMDVQTFLGGIPIGAPVESGFAFTGLWEQVGLVGLAAFLIFMFQLARPVFKGSNIAAVGLLVTVLATNLGEATIASFGGMGLFVWLMIGWSSALAAGEAA